MRVASVRCLPFHRWVLDDVERAARAAGHDVVAIDHAMDGPHGWITGPAGAPSRAALAASEADVVLVADFPYRWLREFAPRAVVVSVRHSLAARGNTYAPEQAHADALASWGDEDERLLVERAGCEPERLVPVGAPWLDAFADVGDRRRRALRASVRAEYGIDGPTPLVALAPTWNGWTPTASLVALVRARPEYAFVLRPHWAASIRWPGLVPALREAGARVDDPLRPPAALLRASDALVTDASGIGLMALAEPTCALPVVQVEPPPEALAGHAQVERFGPEWTARAELGPTVAGPDVASLLAEVDRAVCFPIARTADRLRARERVLRAETIGGAAERLVDALPAIVDRGVR